MASDKWRWSMGGLLICRKIVLFANIPSPLPVYPLCIVHSLPWDWNRDPVDKHRVVTQQEKPQCHWNWELLIFNATFIQLYAYVFSFFMILVYFDGSSIWTTLNISDHSMKVTGELGIYWLSSTCLWLHLSKSIFSVSTRKHMYTHTHTHTHMRARVFYNRICESACL
jgi:hypothetical protein